MRRQKPFRQDDLLELGAFFSEAKGVVSMREIHAGNRDPKVIGVRHDVDNHPEALATAVSMAQWEADNGWRATYFLLHTAKYWRDGRWRQAAETMASLGHEIGLHVDAIGWALQHGGDPHEIICQALDEMRSEGHRVTGIVGHGNRIFYSVEGANDEQFTECVRPQLGPPDRTLVYGGNRVKLEPRPLSDYGLEYESITLRQFQDRHGVMRTRQNQLYNTDSGGKWYYDFRQTIKEFRALTDGQLHLLIHPDHWHMAFVREEIAA